ncbi:MAG TPA: PEP/pyruvate-binding domain-containing protein [Bacteroidales bacterium]
MAGNAQTETLQLLELTSKVSQLLNKKKNIDSTFQKIVDACSVPLSMQIVLNQKTFGSQFFAKNGVWSSIDFSTPAGSKGNLVVNTTIDENTDAEILKKEQHLFLKSVSNMLIMYLEKQEKKIIKPRKVDGPKHKVEEGTISSDFLQKFLNKRTYNRDVFHDLMRYKVQEILLISSLYDAYAIEKEGSFTEHMLGQYGQLNLTSFPRITGASSAEQAMKLLETRDFDLIIYMVGVDKKMPLVVSEKIKRNYPSIPIYLLLNNGNEVSWFVQQVRHTQSIDKIFSWNGDTNIFFSMIKLLEDEMNVENDTEIGKVRVILVVEDSPVYYSRYLSFLYLVIMEQTKRIIGEVSGDELYKVLRMRVRPKILLAQNYEDAVSIINRYKDYMLCLITDVKFERDGHMDENAGLKLVKYIHKDLKSLPTILQSSEKAYEEIAMKYNSLFIHKHSESLYKDFENFITNYLGFGNFVFRDSNGNKISEASNMKQFQRQLSVIPEDSLLYHAYRDNFSMWLMARGEIKAASILNPKKVSDYKDVKELRDAILYLIKEYRNEQETGIILPYSPDIDITEQNIYTLIEGIMGGKGRGLSFINALINNYDFNRFLPDINVKTPKTFIIGIQEFDSFIRNNDLDLLIKQEEKYELIQKQFVNGQLSEELLYRLTSLLTKITKPIAIRSSGMFEDSLTQPFAGIFDTYLLPNNHPELHVRVQQASDAIKLVFASVFSATAKGYVRAINYKMEDEKMAVIIQEVVGNRFGDLYYPHISGVAQSYNFYPFSHMKPEEGFAVAGVGLGKYVVEGNRAYRFSPKYPGTEINSPKDQFRNSQLEFYAVDLAKRNLNLLEGETAGLACKDISVAEKQGTLNHCASVYDADNNVIYPGLNRPGPRIINFANILRYNYIPLAKTIELVLEMGKDAMGTAVEIEYAVDLTKDAEGKASFYILQIKPLISNLMDCNIKMSEIDKNSILLYSKKGMGNGHLMNIRDVIYVDPECFDKSLTEEMALEIEQFNLKMIDAGKQYVLLGPGRWGTRDRWIGIPVKWHQISNAKVIVETSLDNFPLDASSGSHFFHNVTNMNVGYFTVQPELNSSYIDYNKLEKQHLISKGTFLKRVQFAKPLHIKMDGKKRIYLIHM